LAFLTATQYLYLELIGELLPTHRATAFDISIATTGPPWYSQRYFIVFMGTSLTRLGFILEDNMSLASTSQVKQGSVQFLVALEVLSSFIFVTARAMLPKSVSVDR
jgi:hypothetical protein